MGNVGLVVVGCIVYVWIVEGGTDVVVKRWVDPSTFVFGSVFLDVVVSVVVTTRKENGLIVTC